MALYGSIIEWCINNNIPPGHFEQYLKMSDEERAKRSNPGGVYKKPEEMARRIVNACSQYSVAEQVAKDWGRFSSGLRTKITQFANDHGHSGNVTKGLLRLNQILGGKILRRQPLTEIRAGRRETRGQAFVTSPIEWQFAALPKDYTQWSPARKKQHQQRLARERRERRERRGF